MSAPEREPISIDLLAHRLKEVREEKKRLNEADKELSEMIYHLMQKKYVEVSGIGQIERSRSTKWKNWDHDGIRSRVLNLARDRRNLRVDAQGEMESTEEAALRLLTEWGQVSYYRTTALNSWGVDPDEYAEKSVTYTVTLPKPPVNEQEPDGGAAA